MNQAQIIDGLPLHLQGYVEIQNYAAYSAREHALWRFLMGRLSAQLARSAHERYHEGLRKVGISLDVIPDLEVMNENLKSVGWRVLGVSGFIPPSIFMEFQSMCILPIALRMRTLDQVFYTPAPDILHESAGHAPFLVDVDYSEFLQQFGKLGMKALSSRADEASYHAIRKISDLKSVGASDFELAESIQQLESLIAAEQQQPSEAAKLARLHWWTIEYGLVGTLENYKIFGAGLLSSLGESAHCLDDERVPKKLLTVDAINQGYEITHEQPQLFVTHSCRHMRQVLDEMSRGLCQFSGSASAVRTAISCNTLCTLQYSSGLQVSGIVSEVITDAMDNPVYIRTSGPSQLSWLGNQLPGHGVEFHSSGFGSPVGKVNQVARCLSDYTIDELAGLGISVSDEGDEGDEDDECAEAVTLEFVSGISVTGVLIGIERREQRNILFSFTHCTVQDSNGTLLFDPAWGQYDMALGATLVSVSGGAADRATYPGMHSAAVKPPINESVASKQNSQNFQQTNRQPGKTGKTGSLPEDRLLALYRQSRILRDTLANNSSGWRTEYDEFFDVAIETNDWLLLMELYEITAMCRSDRSQTVGKRLLGLIDGNDDLRVLIEEAMVALVG